MIQFLLLLLFVVAVAFVSFSNSSEKANIKISFHETKNFGIFVVVSLFVCYCLPKFQLCDNENFQFHSSML